MSELDKKIGGDRKMQSAKDKAAARWGVENVTPEVGAPNVAPDSPKEKRDFGAELRGWGERPQQNEPFVRSDTRKVEPNGPEE